MTGFERLQEEAEAIAASLPPLLVEAERLTSAVSLGVHGRRKAGIGESFWQFRRYRAEDPSVAIDWRQSAKSQHLYVREREWDAAESIWFWRDDSSGMRFKSSRSAGPTKLERANIIALALASLLVRGGERVALLGDQRGPAASRFALRHIAHSLAGQGDGEALPPDAPIAKHAQLVLVGDFLSPVADIERRIAHFAHRGIAGHLVHIVDPAEEDFPYRGRTRFETAEGRLSETLGRAEAVGDAYRARFKAHAETVAAIGAKFAWSYLRHRTDHSPQTALIALYADLSGQARN